MANIDWEGIINGFRIILGVQLIIVAMLHLFNPKKKNYPLGFTCLFVSLYFFWRFFLPYREHVIMRMFLFSNRELFVPPFAYFVLLQLTNKLSIKVVLRNIAFPLVISLFTMLYFGLFYNSINDVQTLANGITLPALTLISITYFFLGKKQLRTLKKELIPKAYLKFKIFYYGVIFYYFQMGIVSLFSFYITYKFLLTKYPTTDGWVNENTGNVFIDLLAKFINGPFYYYGEFILEPSVYIIPFLLFLFALSELPFFKILFLPKEISYEEKIIKPNSDIEIKLHQFLIDKKQYANHKLNIDICTKAIRCTKKELSDYLKLHKGQTFNAYLNHIRVDMFKSLLVDPNNFLFDIKSIAEMAGFKSRATFYRIFKEIEGITPSQYKEQINKELN